MNDNPLHRIVLIILACLGLLPGIAQAQTTAAADEGTAHAQRIQIGHSVLLHLRNDRLDDALKALETMGDKPTPIPFVEEDCLSSASACVYKALSQLSSEDQFDLLSKWSMPADSPPRIRMITALVPTIAPPVEFARALGARPRSNSFPVSSIGEIRGVFNTGWSLVVAARDSGRLKRFMAELAPLIEKKVPNAELLMSLAQIADGRGEMNRIAETLSQRIKQISAAAPATGDPKTSIDSINVILAAAALQHPTLRPLAEEMFSALVASTLGQPAACVRSFLRQAHATAVLLNHGIQGEEGASPLMKARLKYWVPVSSKLSGSTSPAMSDAVWLTDEDHILHLCGSGNDALMLRYPLQGDFQFQCETQVGGRIETNGGLIFGGVGFQAEPNNEELSLIDAGGVVLEKQSSQVILKRLSPVFQRWSIRSTPTSAAFAANLHPMWSVKTGIQANPWIGLRSFDERRPLFRNLKLTGQPVIPRSVRLVHGPDLRGWQSQVFGERVNSESAVNSDWQFADGVLSATRQELNSNSKRVEEVLAYQRPVLEGESVSYEFFYEEGLREVSPTLGRIAFLIQLDGVRIHWVTDGDRDWTGLTADNTVTEPLNRRGPRPLPLKANAWNRVKISRSEADVTLSLNDVVVYQRPIDWTGDRRFGFYRPQMVTDVQIRNIELAGDWPVALPQEFLDNPAATVGEPTTIAWRHGLNRLFQEEFLAENLLAVRRRALAMPVADRFEFLSRWVLPGPDHPGFRVTGDFTQTQPAPIVHEPGVVDPELGGRIVSPVFDWLDAAKELGQLSECRKRVEGAIAPDTKNQRCARIALLLLLNLEQGDEPAASTNFAALYAILRTPSAEDEWPEMLVIDRCCRRFSENNTVAKYLADIRTLKIQQSRPSHNKVGLAQVAMLLNQAPMAKPSQSAGGQSHSLNLADWLPVSAGTSASRGEGHPVAHWRRTDTIVIKVGSHGEDYLFYRSPLIGDFEVEGDLMDMTHMMIAGSYLGPRFDTRNLDLGTFRSMSPSQIIDPPFSSFVHRVHFRAVIHDGTRSISFNGRPLKSDRLPENCDPWLAIRCSGPNQGGVQDLRITGHPRVPDAVALSGSKDLTGWISYHDEPVPHETLGWTHVDDPESSGWIVGHSNRALSGKSIEGLLRYQRPLVEDGWIEYEFFYEPDRFETHPALDRLSFILDPAGIREHWIGDGRHDRSQLDPDNMADVVDNRRGPARLPLVAREWNRIRLQFRGSRVGVELNGVWVYERDLEPENQRTFGLFHFLGNSAVRVRNATMHGDWPKTVPEVANQELADQLTDRLDADLAGLKSTFSHNFQKDGAPDKYFNSPLTSSVVDVRRTVLGTQVTQRASGPHCGVNLTPRFSLCGDFDIEISFTGLRVESSGDSGIMLNAALDEELRHEYRALRMKTTTGSQDLHQSLGLARSDGGRAYVGTSMPFEAKSGRMRLARRGREVFYLFAEGDSKHFFSFGSEPSSDADTAIDGIFLHSFCNGVGISQVVWTKLVLRAERIKWHSQTPQPAQELLSVMQSDGKGLRVIASAKAAGFTGVCCPKWSSDHRKIVFEMSKGPKTMSHVFVVNADGTELKDLGLGCQPGFSHDGQRIVCSQPGIGIVTMNSDGADRQVIAAAGWGAQWSPDGRWVAYGQDGNIAVMDVGTNKSSPLLKGDAAVRYRSIINLGWSHDSRSIAFKALRQDIIRQELSIADLDEPDRFHIVHPNAHAVSQDITFTPDDQQVLVSMQSVARPEMVLHTLSRKQAGPARPFSVRLPDHKVSGCDWSHDGKMIVISSHYAPQFVEWSSNTEQR